MKLGSISPPLWTAPRYRDKALRLLDRQKVAAQVVAFMNAMR
jgi:hypothetical protein